MLPVVICALAVAALLVAERRGARRAAGVAKLTAASAFVWAAIAWGALESGYGRWLLAGLLLCWLGDALLLSRGRSVGFQLGVAAFLAAHLVYAGAFLRLPTSRAALAISALALAALAAWALRWLRPHLPPDFRIPVHAYVAAIAVMAVVALGATAAGGPPALALGALGFAVSDLSVARERFVSAGFVNSAWGLPLYFAAQLLLASTAHGR